MSTNPAKIIHFSWKNCIKVSEELLMNLFMKKLNGTMMTNEIMAFTRAEISFGFIDFNLKIVNVLI